MMIPASQRGTGSTGRPAVAAVVTAFELEEHELALLWQHCADQLPLETTFEGRRLHGRQVEVIANARRARFRFD